MMITFAFLRLGAANARRFPGVMSACGIEIIPPDPPLIEGKAAEANTVGVARACARRGLKEPAFKGAL
jgi:hypothetical protein